MNKTKASSTHRTPILFLFIINANFPSNIGCSEDNTDPLCFISMVGHICWIHAQVFLLLAEW